MKHAGMRKATSKDWQKKKGTIYFFSNHSDLEPLKQLTGEEVVHIPHPLIRPEWGDGRVLEECKVVIDQAIAVDRLVINGDYFLVSHIVIRRWKRGRITGFMAMEKRNPGTTTKLGNEIRHTNVLVPVGIRWLKPDMK